MEGSHVYERRGGACIGRWEAGVIVGRQTEWGALTVWLHICTTSRLTLNGTKMYSLNELLYAFVQTNRKCGKMFHLPWQCGLWHQSSSEESPDVLLTHHLTAGQLKQTYLSPSSGPRLPRLRWSLEEGIPGVGEGVRPLVQVDGAACPPPHLIGFFYPPSFSQLVCLRCNDSAPVPVHHVSRLYHSRNCQGR